MKPILAVAIVSILSISCGKPKATATRPGNEHAIPAPALPPPAETFNHAAEYRVLSAKILASATVLMDCREKSHFLTRSKQSTAEQAAILKTEKARIEEYSATLRESTNPPQEFKEAKNLVVEMLISLKTAAGELKEDTDSRGKPIVFVACTEDELSTHLIPLLHAYKRLDLMIP